MEKDSRFSLVTLLFLFLMVSSIIPIVYGQPDDDNDKRLPILLIHGYLNDKSVWDEWVMKLETAGFNVKAVEFNGNDKCGSAADHARQLRNIVKDFKTSSGSEKINIVGHSKGGLDARVYLANNIANDDVANLIMIGTPNAGSPRAENRDLEVINNANIICSPFPDQAINDLIPGAAATEVKKNNHTQYHTIAGDWKNIPEFCTQTLTLAGCVPFDFDCRSEFFNLIEYQREGSKEIKGPDDGIVPLKSVESGGFNSLGNTDNCHTNLFSDEEFEKAMTILNP
jgi:uncharacterized alpha/beta hydrolase family protein